MSDQILFTFVIERLGWTFVEQVRAETLRGATIRWSKTSANIKGVDVERADFVAPSLIDGASNTWFFSTRDAEDVAVFVNVVATVQTPI